MPSAPPPIADLLARLERVFATLGLRWFLFGAQAAILYGVARLSVDVDVTVDLGGRSSAELVGALAEAGFELRVADIAGFAEATRVLPFVHRESRIPVDVVLAGPGLEEQFFAGVEERLIGDARATSTMSSRDPPRARPRPRLASDPDHPGPARGGLGPPRPSQRTGATDGRRARGRAAAEGLKPVPLEACGARTGLEVHHVRNARPPGGSDVDLDQFVAVPRPCHEQADALYAASRHVVAPLRAGRFAFDVVRHPPKWDGVALAPTQHQTGASATMVLEGSRARETRSREGRQPCTGSSRS